MKERNAVLRIILHGFFLISTNLFSLIAAIAFIQLTSAEFNKISQAAIALIINLAIYLLVYKLMHGIQKEIMEIDDYSMFIIILLISMALLPAVFYPLQYMSSGNWSSFDNIINTWIFQVVVNGLCLTINHFVLDKKLG